MIVVIVEYKYSMRMENTYMNGVLETAEIFIYLSSQKMDIYGPPTELHIKF